MSQLRKVRAKIWVGFGTVFSWWWSLVISSLIDIPRVSCDLNHDFRVKPRMGNAMIIRQDLQKSLMSVQQQQLLLPRRGRERGKVCRSADAPLNFSPFDLSSSKEPAAAAAVLESPQCCHGPEEQKELAGCSRKCLPSDAARLLLSRRRRHLFLFFAVPE